MPLHKPNEVKHLILPSSKDLPEGDKEWVDMIVGPILGGDMLRAMNAPQQDMTATIMLNRIQAWSIKDANGEVAPVEMASLSTLDVGDLAYLMNEFVGGDEVATSTDPKEQKQQVQIIEG